MDEVKDGTGDVDIERGRRKQWSLPRSLDSFSSRPHSSFSLNSSSIIVLSGCFRASRAGDSYVVVGKRSRSMMMGISERVRSTNSREKGKIILVGSMSKRRPINGSMRWVFDQRITPPKRRNCEKQRRWSKRSSKYTQTGRKMKVATLLGILISSASRDTTLLWTGGYKVQSLSTLCMQREWTAPVVSGP